MSDISWLTILLFSVPECILVITLGLHLINCPTLSIKHILIIMLIYAPIVFVIRNIDLLYGLTTFVLAITCVLLLFFVCRISIIKGAIAVMLGLAIDLALEAMFLSMFSYFTGVQFGEILINPFYNIVFGAPQLVVMLCAVLYLKKRKIYLFNLNKGVEDEI